MKNPEIIRLAFNKGYRVTPLGLVITKTGRHRRIYFNPRGYGSFGINLPDKTVRRVEVHKLAAFQKFGERSLFGLETRHLDGNPSNNSLDNIEIGTHSENMLDQTPQKRQRKAQHAANQLRRFTAEEVQTIRDEHEQGSSYKTLSEKWKVGKGQLSYMLSKTAKAQANY